MTVVAFEINAVVREQMGKHVSRQLRRQKKIPGVVYGGGDLPVHVIFEQNQIMRALEQEPFYSHILTLNMSKIKERVVLKEVQRHPYKPMIMHLDFQRVRADEKLQMLVPLHFIGEEDAPGVLAGGVVLHLMNNVEVTCLPQFLPEYLTVDLKKTELNHTLHLSDIVLTEGIELTALSHGDDKSVVSIHVPRVLEEESVTPPDELATQTMPATSAQKNERMNKADSKSVDE